VIKFNRHLILRSRILLTPRYGSLYQSSPINAIDPLTNSTTDTCVRVKSMVVTKVRGLLNLSAQHRLYDKRVNLISTVALLKT
jgi:hypothetical protein